MKKSTLLIAVLTPLLVLANLAFTPPGDGGYSGELEDCQNVIEQLNENHVSWGIIIWAWDCKPEVYIEDMNCYIGHSIFEWTWDACTSTFTGSESEYGTYEACGYYGGPA